MRFRKHDGGKFFQFERWENGEWFGGPDCMNQVRRVPYHLERVIHDPRARRLFIAEGEKCCDALYDFGLIGTTNDAGAGKWPTSFNEFLRGRAVFVLPDNDELGRKHARLICESLIGIARSIRFLDLPGLGPKEDVYDFLMRAGDVL
ncbi:hypothetical protein HYR69_10520 [Candidatus Sumerlaeota bacterium]|nr:hypothetical protein [Candidatus Sumerlaeota bacterium]